MVEEVENKAGAAKPPRKRQSVSGVKPDAKSNRDINRSKQSKYDNDLIDEENQKKKNNSEYAVELEDKPPNT